jgi:hypothetical protein
MNHYQSAPLACSSSRVSCCVRNYKRGGSREFKRDSIGDRLFAEPYPMGCGISDIGKRRVRSAKSQTIVQTASMPRGGSEMSRMSIFVLGASMSRISHNCY